MSYHLRPDYKASKEVARVARKRLKKARSALTGPVGERAKGIHQSRKRFKELRALLRLIRKPLGKTFDVENKRLRDAARLLSSSRDATALVESWDALAASDNKVFQQKAMRDIRQRLVKRRPEEVKQSEDQAIIDVLAAVEDMEREVARWRFSSTDFELFAEGLEKTYRDGRKALALAAKDPSAHNLHEWRKRVKDHWYHTRLLLLGWPEQLKVRCTFLKELSDLLGDDHDLSMLCLLLHNEPELFGDEATIAQLDEIMQQRREALQSRALRLGRRLYAESPKALRQRWQRYWKITRRERRAKATS